MLIINNKITFLIQNKEANFQNVQINITVKKYINKLYVRKQVLCFMNYDMNIILNKSFFIMLLIMDIFLILPNIGLATK